MVAGVAAVAVYVIVVVPWSRIRRRAKRQRGELPAILWGPQPILNIRYSALAERRLGYRSDTLVYDVYRINDRVAVRLRPRRAGVALRSSAPSSPTRRSSGPGCATTSSASSSTAASSGPTPFWRAELTLLKLAGKKVVVYPYGSDARLASSTRALGRWHAYTDVAPGAEDRDESVVRERRTAFGRYADLMLGCNDLAEDLPRLDGILPYPFPCDEWTPVPEDDDGVVTIVHPANHRHYKGTRFLERRRRPACRPKGLPVELVLVEGLPNEEARAIYERADIVASDLLIGGYALAAIEAMALGKPVIAYLPQRLRALHPEWSDAPIVDADPDTLADELRALVVDAELRRQLGARGPGYVERVHGLDVVGALMDRHYRRLWGLPPR